MYESFHLVVKPRTAAPDYPCVQVFIWKNSFLSSVLWMQVVMPTVESDVAFGLGKLKLPLDEVRLRVSKSLDAVGMLSYSQVGI